MNVRGVGDEPVDDSTSGLAPTAGAVLPSNLVDDAPVGLGLIDSSMRWAYLNDAFLGTTGLERARILGRPVAATPFAADAAVIARIFEDADFRDATVGGEDGVLGRLATPDWYVRYRRFERDGIVIGVIAAVMGSAPGQQRELDRVRHRLAAQHAATERIGSSLDIDVTCDELARFTVPGMSDLTVVEVIPDEIVERGAGADSAPPRMRRAAFACTPEMRRRIGAFNVFTVSGTAPARPGADTAVAQSLRACRPVTADLRSAGDGGPAETAADCPGDGKAESATASAAVSAAELEAYQRAGVEAIMAVPLIARGQLVGAMTLARVGAPHQGFTDDDVVLAQDLADRAAVSVENARQYADSQRITLALQRALLVEPGPPHSNLEVAARYLPLGSRSLVGGDWYEIVRLPFGRTLLVMADVMGHGMEAAVDMSNYRSVIRELGSMDLPPHGILQHLDRVIAQDESARPATCLLAIADPNRGRWALASAGHLPPALFVPGRPTRLIPTPIGPPLGTGVGGYEQIIVDLLPEQILLLYTDGLVERRGEDIDASLERLAAVGFPPSGEPESLVDKVLQALASSTPDDDIAILAARIHPGRESSFGVRPALVP